MPSMTQQQKFYILPFFREPSYDVYANENFALRKKLLLIQNMPSFYL